MKFEDIVKIFSEFPKFSNVEELNRYLNSVKRRYYGDTFYGKRSLEDLTTIGFLFRNRRNCDGKCCQCGSCCDRVLQLTKREQRGILDYLKEHPEIRRTIDSINKGKPHRKCPFLDHTREKEKCLIYELKEFFPAICSTYNCDEEQINVQELFLKLRGDMPEYVDMWHLIGDPENIAKAWEFTDSLSNHFGIRLGPQIMLYPEKLNTTIKELIATTPIIKEMAKILRFKFK